MPNLPPLVVAVLVILAVGSLTWNEWQRIADARLQRAVQVATVVAMLGTAFVAWTVAGERAAVVAGTLRPGTSLEVPADQGHLALLVRPTADEEGHVAQGKVHLAVEDGAHNYLATARIDQHDEQVRARRGSRNAHITHLEDRVSLPGDFGTLPMHVTMRAEEGDLKGAVAVEAVPAPPSLLAVGLGGLAIATAGASLDVLDDKKTRLGYAMSFFGAFSALLLDRITPHGAASPVLGAVALAGFAALVGGFTLRTAMGWLIERVPPLARVRATVAPAAK